MTEKESPPAEDGSYDENSVPRLKWSVFNLLSTPTKTKSKESVQDGTPSIENIKDAGAKSYGSEGGRKNSLTAFFTRQKSKESYPSSASSTSSNLKSNSATSLQAAPSPRNGDSFESQPRSLDDLGNLVYPVDLQHVELDNFEKSDPQSARPSIVSTPPSPTLSLTTALQTTFPNKLLSPVQIPTTTYDLPPIQPSDDRPSKLQRVLSATTTPLFSWLKGTRPDTTPLNPMLHLATFAMQLQQADDDASVTSKPMSTIHNVGGGEFWEADDESSVESFDSSDEVARKKESELTIEEKLQLVFELPELEAYQKELACWLVRSVLLKGYMYITTHHICFYAALPTVPGSVRKEGFLMRKPLKLRTSTFSTYWFVLKTDGLYIYPDSKQLYYPKTTIYLRFVYF